MTSHTTFGARTATLGHQSPEGAESAVEALIEAGYIDSDLVTRTELAAIIEGVIQTSEVLMETAHCATETEHLQANREDGTGLTGLRQALTDAVVGVVDDLEGRPE